MTLDLKNVLYEQDGDVVTVTINRPQHLNAVSRRVYFELDEAFRHAEEDPSVKVIVVTGAGDHFGAGHDLGTEEMRSELDEFPRDMTPEGRIRTMDRGVYFRLHDRWRNLAKPTIAMVQGYCIMGSWMVASCCDLIVASEDAKFTDRSVRWGVVSHEYVTQFFDLGIKKAKEILWTGDFLTAEEAEKTGMVNRVVPREELREATMWLARRIALNDSAALHLSKMQINQAWDVMGLTAAVRSSSNMWLINATDRAGSREDNPNRVSWSKSQNQRFEDYDKAYERPW